jgi:hypothetical protein
MARPQGLGTSSTLLDTPRHMLMDTGGGGRLSSVLVVSSAVAVSWSRGFITWSPVTRSGHVVWSRDLKFGWYKRKNSRKNLVN